LQRPKLELRAWLAIEVGKIGGASAATYEERLSVGCKATRRRGGGGFHQGVRLGHARGKEDDYDGAKRARMSATQRERRRARRLRLRMVGPAHYAARGREAGLAG
jgi:hypothetical protein